MSDLVRTSIDAHIARLTLNRPERHNSLVPELLEDLLAGLNRIQAEPQVRVVILDANGRSFSTGGDVLGFFQNLDSIASYAGHTLGLLNEAIITMLSLPIPIIAAVHGIVTGGSLGLVLSSDIVLLAPEASFTPYYSVVGFSPDGGWTALLPDLIGEKRVAETLMTNSTITAEQALAWGLGNRLVPGSELQAQTLHIAEHIATMKPGSLRSARTLLAYDLEETKARLDAERDAFVTQIQTDEARVGMQSFLRR